jgi:ketosteroid isomerase-like protein
MWEEIADAVPEQDSWEAATERWWHPELVYEEDPKWPGSGAYRGREEVRGVFEGYAQVMGSATFSLEDILEGAEDVVALVRVRGASSSGIPWDRVWGYRCRTRDGQLSFLYAHFDPADALKAAGLR